MSKKRKPKNYQPKKKEDKHLLNIKISRFGKVTEVRLVGDNVETGVYSLEEALAEARNQNLDLVEINPKTQPTICKIIDYQKFLYDLKKKQKAQDKKNKQNQVQVKELRFGPNTDEHDYNFKKKHAEKFLTEGNKVKAYVFFKGREMQFKDKGFKLLARLTQDLDEFLDIENAPKLEGRRITTVLKPKKKNKK
jgi:translation initiation factor IF-3